MITRKEVVVLKRADFSDLRTVGDNDSVKYVKIDTVEIETNEGSTFRLTKEASKNFHIGDTITIKIGDSNEKK